MCSIGADPERRDRGEEPRYLGYWQEYSFGELREQGQGRRELLERLVPRLAIANRLRLEDRYVVVDGELRTYNIQLGSANVLMEPNNEYLCIVRGRKPGGSDRVLLPFEGDQTLALILSKALPLVRDDRIEDETIRAQITRR